MYAFLLALGAVMTAAGFGLLASGISIPARAFDPTNVTPATIAVIGGCILIGLAFVVRALLRVEHALISRPAARPVRPGQAGVEATAAAAPPSEAARIPFPSKPKAPPPLPQQPAVAVAAPVSAEAVSEAARAASPQATEHPPLVEDVEVSLLSKPSVRAEEAGAEAKSPGAGRTNGAASGKASSPPSALGGAPAPQQQQGKSSIFDALWPKTQRAAPDINTAPAMPQQATAPAAATALQPTAAAASSPPPVPPTAHETGVAVSILKSGVVEGMAYTLYSDGSIEAQLPAGTVRFGSITELRNHIEKSA